MMAYKVLDLFSGAGGLSRGFYDAGYDVVLGVDFDEAALKTFKANHGKAEAMKLDLFDHSNIDVIINFLKEKDIKLDVLVGGPPCQGFSVAGPRDMNDKRNMLYTAMVELAERVKPQVVVYYSKLTALGFGTTALPGMAIANPAHHGYINYIIAHAIAITIGFVCTVIFGKMWSAPDKNKNDKKNDTKENDTTKAVITEEPGAVYAAAEGTVKDIEASTDPTFANKVLGDGVVIFPEDGTVMAPCKATVSLVYPTGHAIGLTTADGAEILIHCGVDTVNMNGEGFETLVKEGQEVTAEEALIRFDIDLVKKHGYSPEILVIFTELPEGKTIKTEEKHIAKNDKMAEIV